MEKIMMLVEVFYPGMIEGKDGNNIIYKNNDMFHIDPTSIQFGNMNYVLCKVYSLSGEFLGVTDGLNFKTIGYLKANIKEDK